MLSAGYQITVDLNGCHARWLYGVTLAPLALTVCHYIKDCSWTAILDMFCLSQKTRVLFLSGHSDPFWVTVSSAWGWGEGRTGCILAALQAWSSILQPAP